MKNGTQKMRRKQGFTLAEMLVTVAIMIILLGVGLVAYVQWMRVSNFRHNNDVADTMFSVLQSELSERRANNTLNDFKSELKTATKAGNTDYVGELPLADLTDEDGGRVTLADIYSGFDYTPGTGFEYGTVYYIKGTKADWQAYQNGTLSNRLLKTVYDMFTDYLFEGDYSMLDGSICVELDPAEGLVYSVFFTNQDTELTYKDGGNLLDRQTGARRHHRVEGAHFHIIGDYDLVGYSGVKTLSLSTNKSTVKPVIKDLMLNNEETLNLNFLLDPSAATTVMNYTITLNDTQTQKKLLNIVMDGKDLKKKNDRSNPFDNKPVKCTVTWYGADGELKKDRAVDMYFPAWWDSVTGKVTLVLDAVDYDAASLYWQIDYTNYLREKGNLGSRLYPSALQKTYSIYRLGIEQANTIYCTVYAAGGGFATTATKTSNNACRAFASAATERDNSGNTTRRITVENNRHLYNLRFSETEALLNADAAYDYKLRKNIDFNTIEVYKYDTTGATVNPLSDPAPFPSLPLLGEKSALSSAGDNQYALDNFTFTKQNNIDWLKIGFGSEEDINGTGLFLKSSGTIENLELTDVMVNGVTSTLGYSSDRTGGFCGTNAGRMNHLETAGTSEVNGKNYVGGIFGYYAPKAAATEPGGTKPKVEITEMVNAAKVSGECYVGGITGMLSGEYIAAPEEEADPANYTVRIRNSTNTGTVAATPTTATDNAMRAYIGGIVGLVDTAAVTDCTSDPSLSAAPPEKELSGYCVGGIVGFAYDTMLNGCSTKQVGITTGYVAGDRFVGGIVGLCVGKSVVSGTDIEHLATNAINVVGKSYVGGIVGCNANIKVLKDGVATPGTTEFDVETLKKSQSIVDLIKEIKSDNTKTEPWYDKTNLDPEQLTPISTKPSQEELGTISVKYWENKGTITAYDFYTGGITGYNTGLVEDCISSVYQTSAKGIYATYAGGIAGYNNGTLESTLTDRNLSVVCDVRGKDYVGGVVGYNDVDAVVKNYQLNGGNVVGTGSFIGGYAGVNASVNLLQVEDEDGKMVPFEIQANPNTVQGRYAVGGTIGANIVPVPKANEETPVLATFNVSNFVSIIEATKSVAGGYIGYNALPVVANGVAVAGQMTAAEAGLNNARDALRNAIEAATDELDRLEDPTAAAVGTGQNLALSTLDKIAHTLAVRGTDGAIFYISKENSTIETYGSGIKAQIAAGGVLGFSCSDTTLNIMNVTNKVHVQVTKAIPHSQLTVLVPGLDTSAIYQGQETYSLAGGIIGIANQKTTLKNCRNETIGLVTSVGTYRGGLVEANLGIISECIVSSHGNTQDSNVGGIAGINFSTIQGSRVAGTTSVISGHSCVGGIAAENYGNITTQVAKADSILAGADAPDIISYPFNGLSVQAGGDNVGGVAGYNGRSNTGAHTGEIVLVEQASVTVGASGSNVGGIVGYNKQGLLATKVTQENGDASVSGSVTGGNNVGGIVGRHEDGTLEQFVNKALVTATATGGNAAGIVGEARGTATVQYCINNGDVTSNGGDAAGIVAVNGSSTDPAALDNPVSFVRYCANYANISAPAGSAGGICATNRTDAGIENCAALPQNPDTTLESGEESWWVNGFAPWVKNSFSTVIKACAVRGYGNVGGIVGTNHGTVSGSRLKSITVENYGNSAATSLVGGLAGENTGTITMLPGKNGYIGVTVRSNRDTASVGGVIGENSGLLNGNGAELGGSISETITVGFPTKYTIYDYIESKGNATDGKTAATQNKTGGYIPTDYVPNGATRIVFDGYVVSGDTALFGSRVNSSSKSFAIQKTSYGTAGFYRSNYDGEQQDFATTYPCGVRYTFSLDRTQATISADGVLQAKKTHKNTNLTGAPKLYLLGLNTNNTPSNLGNVRMYSAQIYEDDELVHNYLPASYTDESGTHYGVMDTIVVERYNEDAPGAFFEYKTVGAIQAGWETPNVPLDTGWQYIAGIVVTFSDNLTMDTGSAVTTANLGFVAGMNAQGGRIIDITATDCMTTNGVQRLLGGETAGYGGIAGQNAGQITHAHFNGSLLIDGSSAAIASVGGIAGQNRSTGVIQECDIGMGGLTDVEATVFGYVGGITGWNYGEIISCDNYKENDGNSVLVKTKVGHVGGIVGNAAPGSALIGTRDKPIRTGSRWSVESASPTNDCGTGGIIGFSESGNRGKALEYVVNHASVSGNAAGSNNMAIGGIIGRSQNNENTNMVFNNCENRGAVSGLGGTTMVGGLIGRIKYLGLTFQNCVNTGAISGSTRGGIVGDDYMVSSASTLINCVNFGSAASAGLYGNNQGINLNKVANVTFIRCRNYGATGCGICEKAVLIEDCFDFRTSNSKLTNQDNSRIKDSYQYNANGDKGFVWAFTGSKWPLTSTSGGGLMSIGIPNKDWLGTNTLPAGFATGTPTTTDLYNALEYTDRISLNFTDSGRNDDGQSLPLIEWYYRDKYYLENPVKVENLTLTQTGNTLTASWTKIGDAYGYKVCYEVDMPDGTVYYLADIVFTNSWTVQVPAEWEGCNMKLYVQAVGGNMPAWQADEKTNPSELADSYWTDTAEQQQNNWSQATTKVEISLPTPDVYLELGGIPNGTKADPTLYVAVLRNTADFDEYLQKSSATQVTVNVSGATLSGCVITYDGNPMTANSTKAQTISGTDSNNATLAATATVNIDGKTLKSGTSNQQFYVLSGPNLRDTVQLQATFTGFNNVLPAELTFGLTMTAKTNTGSLFLFQESELVTERTLTVAEADGTQTEYRMPMAVTDNITRRTGQDGDTLSIVLDGLPENLLEGENPQAKHDFAVYNYPWYGQNRAIYFGHAVAEGITAENLLALTDPLRNGDPVFDAETRQPNLGYVVYQNIAADGTISYEVRYSALLANESVYQKNVNHCQYTYDPTDSSKRNASNQVTVVKTLKAGVDGTSWYVQPYPVATEDRAARTDSSYKFTWKDSKPGGQAVTDANGSYYLQLYGIDANDPTGQRVLLQTTSILTSSSKDDQGNRCFDSGTGWQYTFADATGNWNYATMFLRVTKVGTASDGKTNVWPYYDECTITQRQRFTTMSAPNLTVVQEQGKDLDDVNYTINWSAISDGLDGANNCPDFYCYEITVSDVTVAAGHTPVETKIYYVLSDGTVTTLKPVTPDGSQAVQPQSQTSAIMELDDFCDCDIAVSMKALALADTDPSTRTYRDGAPGTVRNMNIPAHLPNPEPEKTDDHDAATLTPPYDENSATPSVDIVNNGLLYTVPKNPIYAAINGQYRIALAIYDGNPDEISAAQPATLLYTIDLGTDNYMVGRLNAGDSTYNIKNALKTTDGEEIQLVNLAGKWIQVTLRATSSNDFSSRPVTKSYRIPRIKLEAPLINEAGTEQKEYQVYDEEGPISYENKLKTQQEKFNWENDVNNGGYIVHLTRTNTSVDGVLQLQAYEWQLLRSDDGKLHYAGQELTAEEVKLPYQVYIEQTLGDTPDPETPPEEGNPSDEAKTYYTTLYSYLSLVEEGDASYINLLLPDNTEQDPNYPGFDHTGRWTQNITVQTLSKDENQVPSMYENSDGRYQARLKTDEITYIWVTGMQDMAKLPVVGNPAEGKVPFALNYNSEEAAITASYIDFAESDVPTEHEGYRLMLRLRYDDGTTSDEYPMTALDGKGDNHSLALAEIEGVDGKTIASAELRIIVPENHSLFGGWSDLQPLAVPLDGPVVLPQPEQSIQTPETAQQATPEQAMPSA